MKVALISKSSSIGGGASRIAQELTGALNLRPDIQATHWRAYGDLEQAGASAPLYGERPWLRKGLKGLRQVSSKLGLQELIPFELPVVAKSQLMAADLLHVHDITTAVSPLTLHWLAQRKPMIWTFHDVSPFTGGCIYPHGCTQYLRDCSRCPQTKAWPICGLLPSPAAQLRTKRKLGKAAFWITTPSQWMANQAKAGGCYPTQPLSVISNGVDAQVFRPGPRIALREQLGLVPDRLTLVISAGHLADTSKGIGDAVSVVRAVASRLPTQVIAVGRENPALTSALAGIPVCATGYLQSPRLLALSYAAGDALVYCSRADNQPLTVMENMAVGNAIYAYDTGGIPEMLEDKHGLVVPKGNTAQLADAIIADWTSGELSRKGQQAHKKAAVDYSLEQMTDRFISLYAEVLSATQVHHG